MTSRRKLLLILLLAVWAACLFVYNRNKLSATGAAINWLTYDFGSDIQELEGTDDDFNIILEETVCDEFREL